MPIKQLQSDVIPVWSDLYPEYIRFIVRKSLKIVPFNSQVVGEVTGPEMASDLPVRQPASSLSFKRGSFAQREQRHTANTRWPFSGWSMYVGWRWGCDFLPEASLFPKPVYLGTIVHSSAEPAMAHPVFTLSPLLSKQKSQLRPVWELEPDFLTPSIPLALSFPVPTLARQPG